MVDVVNKKTRSRMMSGIQGKNTAPELRIRRELHKRGYRYRLHMQGLPGKPDIALPKHNALILINGCFWHGHNCHLFKWPSTRKKFWEEKINGTKARDAKNLEIYKDRGWRALTVWECALKGKSKLSSEVLFEMIEDWILGTNDCCEIRCSNQID